MKALRARHPAKIHGPLSFKCVVIADMFPDIAHAGAMAAS